MRLLRTLVLLVIVFSPASVCLGQSDQANAPAAGDDQSEEKKQYQVEIIAFQYRGADSSGGEEFDTLFVEDYFPPKPFDIDEYTRVREAISYTQLTYLADALERLRLDPLYTVMLDVAWVQPLLNKDEAVDVPVGYEGRTSTYSLHAGSREPVATRLSGSVRVYGDYFLFVDLDLRLTVPPRIGNNRPSEGKFDSPTFGSLTAEQSSSQPDKVKVFHISEKRRIKLDEIHYFDHPRIGALVSVTRYEEEPGAVPLQ